MFHVKQISANLPNVKQKCETFLFHTVLPFCLPTFCHSRIFCHPPAFSLPCRRLSAMLCLPATPRMAMRADGSVSSIPLQCIILTPLPYQLRYLLHRRKPRVDVPKRHLQTWTSVSIRATPERALYLALPSQPLLSSRHAFLSCRRRSVSSSSALLLFRLHAAKGYCRRSALVFRVSALQRRW